LWFVHALAIVVIHAGNRCPSALVFTPAKSKDVRWGCRFRLSADVRASFRYTRFWQEVDIGAASSDVCFGLIAVVRWLTRDCPLLPRADVHEARGSDVSPDATNSGFGSSPVSSELL